MARYMAFIDGPVEPADFGIESDPDASLAEDTRRLAEAAGMKNGKLFYTMSKFYAVSIFEAPDNRAAERIVRNIRNAADVNAEVVPIFRPSDLEE